MRREVHYNRLMPFRTAWLLYLPGFLARREPTWALIALLGSGGYGYVGGFVAFEAAVTVGALVRRRRLAGLRSRPC